MILAIDTATRWTGAALYDGTAVLAELGRRSTNTQTIELAPAIKDLFSRAAISAEDLKAIAVAIGPGSYTGLRVGLAVAKGLALAYQTPLVGVPTLDIVAAAFGPLEEELVAIAEAGRTRVCAGRYSWQGRKGWQANGRPVIAGWDVLLEKIEGPALFAGEITPDAAKRIRASQNPVRAASPASGLRRAGFLAEIGWQRWRRGQVADAAALSPDYLRAPEGA